MNPWFLAGAMAMVISSYFYGHHEAYVEQVAEVQRLQLIEQQKETEMQQAAQSQAEQLRKANQDAQAQITHLRSDIASGELRLSIATRSVQSSENAGTAPGNSETRAELDPEAAQSLVTIAGDGDNAIRKLNACVDLYNQVRSKQ